MPTVFFVTDPDRTPDPLAVARGLPRGTGVIFRGFGRAGALETARRLSRLARARGLVLLIGADEGMAATVRADGVHLPERMRGRAPLIRRRRPHWIITGAAHGQRGLAKGAGLGLDAFLLSTAFASRSPSAGPPLGPVRLAAMIRRAKKPVIALGGVNAATAERLAGTGAAGFAAVEALV